MKKLSELKLADWQKIAADKGIEAGELTTNELISAIADAMKVKVKGDDKAAKAERKKAVYAALVAEEDAGLPAEGSDDNGDDGDGVESGDGDDSSTDDAPKSKLAGMSLDELQSLATKENINVSMYTDVDDIIKMIEATRAMRAKNLEESKSSETMARRIHSKGAKEGVPTKGKMPEVDPKQSFEALCKNVCGSFTSGIFGRRKPTVAEVTAHVENTGAEFKIVEKKETKKLGKHVLLVAKFGKEEVSSEPILVQ